MEKILVCDDDKEIAESIEIYLEDEFKVFKAYDGAEALKIVKSENIRLVVIDIMMPLMNGFRFVKELRTFSGIPVIFLSAKSEDADKILGLNIGADDYITKPFNPLELVARVKSNLRRYMRLGAGIGNDNIYKTGELVVDDTTKQCYVLGEKIRLTPIEYSILRLLIMNKGVVYSIDQIYKQIWDDAPVSAENTIAVHIRHIREKIEINPKSPRYLKLVWGVGYKIDGEEIA